MTTSRVLSLLAALASPVFMVAAVAGWLTGYWPANPYTLGLSAVLVIAGPALGIVHVAMVRELEEEDDVTEVLVPEPPRVAAPARSRFPGPPVSPQHAAARAFHNWRDSPVPAIERRDRARRAERYLRSA